MPELPEVETIRRGIDRHLRGHRIVSVEGGGGRLVRNNPQGMVDLHAHLTNSQVTAVERRGKFMWVEFDEADNIRYPVNYSDIKGQMYTQNRRDLP